MVIGIFIDNRFDGLLPDDGVYAIRVLLMRSAGRRNEASDYTLSLGVVGTPLAPVSVKVDTHVSGHPLSRQNNNEMRAAHSQARECETYVVRRGFDGTATVELRWDGDNKRRILFVKGEPKGADVPQTLTFTRYERGWRVSFNNDEHFDVPEALVSGG